MWRMVAGTALVCILLAGGAVVAAEAVSPPLVLKTEAGWVDVFRPDGSFLQSLPIEGDESDEDNRDFFTFVKDMDFDGFPDVGILFSQGQKAYYDAWLWRPDAEAFVGYEEMREIPSPRFDSESKRVTSHALVGRGSEKTILAWVNGMLAPLERTTQCLNGDSGSVVIGRYLRGVDGELRLVSEETRRPMEEEACGDGGEVTPAHGSLHGNATGVQGCYALKSDTLDGYMTVREDDEENVHAVHIFAIRKDGANNTGEVDGIGKLVGNTIAIKYGGDDPDAIIDVIFTGETAKVVTSEEFRGSGWLGAGVILDGEYTRERK